MGSTSLLWTECRNGKFLNTCEIGEEEKERGAAGVNFFL